MRFTAYSIRGVALCALILLWIAVVSAAYAADAPPISSFPLPQPSSDDEALSYFPRYLLGNAYDAVNAGNYHQAQNFLERALGEEPGNPKMLRMLVNILLRLEYWPEADKRLTELLTVEPDNAPALMWRGYVRFLMRRGGESRDDLSALLSMDPSPEIRSYAERLLVEVEAFNQPFEAAAAAQWDAIRARTEELEKSGDLAGLEAYYEELRQQPGLEAFAIAARGFARLRFGRAEDAEKDFALALSRSDLDAATREDVQAALSGLQAERKMLAEWNGIETAKAELEEKGDLRGLEQFYGELAGSERYRCYALSSRGFLRLGMGRTEDAKDDFTRALECMPFDDESRADVVLALERISRDAEAAAEWARISQTAEELEAAGDAAALERFYAELIKTDKYQSYAMVSRAFLRLRQGVLREAEEAFAAALARDDLDQAVKADILAAMNRIAADRRTAEEWDEIRRTVAELEKQGDKKGLEELYGRLADADAYRAFALVSRGYLRMGDGRSLEAAEDFRGVLALEGLDGAVRSGAAAALERVENAHKSAVEWERARKRAADLRAAGSLDALEEFYGELAADPSRRAYALTSRGYLRMERGKLDEAERDFSLALELESLEAGARAEVEAALARLAVDKKIRELEKRGDAGELERYYTELSTDPPSRERALTARGYLLLGRRNEAAAERDFRAVLKLPDLAPENRREVEATLAAMASSKANALAAEEWPRISEAVKTLEESGDLNGIEMLLAPAVSGGQKENAYAHALLGVNRVSLGRPEEGREAMAQSIALGGLDGEYREFVEKTLAATDAALAAGEVPPNPYGAELIRKTRSHLSAGEYDLATARMCALSGLPLNADQKGALLYFGGEMRLAEEDAEGALPLFVEAAEMLLDGELLSEALWRVSEHYQRKGPRELAVRYARQSVAADPDKPWRNAQLGYMFFKYRMNEEAILYFENALEIGTLDEQEKGFYRDLATAYLRIGDRERFHWYMKRHIDKDEAKIDAQTDKVESDIEAWYGARQYHAAVPKRLRGQLYLFASTFENGDYLVQTLNEVSVRVTGFNAVNVEAYMQATGAVASSFSGTYFNAWGGSYDAFSGNSHLGDSFKVALGLRVRPFGGWSLGLDRVFKIGRDVESDVRLRLEYYRGVGDEWEPCRLNWTYASLYSDATYSLEHSDFTYFGEARAGRRFRLGRAANTLAVTPYVGMTVSGGGKNVTKSERWAAEAGPGVSLKKWVRESKYYAPRASWEMNVQYRFGLTHNRKDVLQFTLSHSF